MDLCDFVYTFVLVLIMVVFVGQGPKLRKEAGEEIGDR